MFKNFKKDRCYIIAEIGGNFTDLKTARRLVDHAADCGVDAVKLQTFRADTLSTRNAVFDMENTGIASQYALFRKYEIGKELHARIFAYAQSKGLDWFSTPSHETDADMLEELGADSYKVGSDDAVNIPFLKRLAKKKKPILLATGMCTLREVRKSVAAIKTAGNTRIILMHAVTSYPTHPEDVNLLAMKSMMAAFPGLPVGYSDHTIGITACLAAAALGARAVEKHFTFDKNAEGPDHMLSADPEEMRALVRGIRDIELMLGSGIKRPAKGEKITRLNNRKSVVLELPVKKGERLSRANLAVKRPGRGIEPEHYDEILGRTALRNLKKDALLRWGDFR
jgi:N-acetylneuraminate synthase